MKTVVTNNQLFYSFIALALVIAMHGCQPDQDVQYDQLNPTEQIAGSQFIDEPSDDLNESEASKGGRAVIVIFEDFTRNIPYVYNAETMEAAKPSPLRNGRYIIRVKPGKYVFEPVLYNRDIPQIPIRLKAGDKIRFGWPGYVPNY